MNNLQLQNMIWPFTGFILSNKSHIFKGTELLSIAFVGWVTLSISRTV